MHNKIQPLLDWLKIANDTDVAETGTTRGYLRRIAYGQKVASAEMSSGIERATHGAVTRKMLRTSDWHRVWPELAERSLTLNANLRPISPPGQSTVGAGVLSSTHQVRQ